MRKSIITVLFFLISMMISSLASAQNIYKNRDAKGRAVFTDRALHDSERVSLPQTNVAKPITGRSNSSSQSGRGFSMMNTAPATKKPSGTRRRSCGG